MVQVRIKQSKTDLFRKGVLVYVGRTGGELCPVAAMTAHLAIRGRAPGPFFFDAWECSNIKGHTGEESEWGIGVVRC